MKTLDEIALGYRTDKSSPYHNYTPVYDSYFIPLRFKAIVLLELGIGDIHSENREGESILMWRDYFDNGKCYAIDNDPVKVARSTDCFLCSQDDKNTLEQVVKVIGNPDIIIDDCSHIQSLTIKSFEILFPLLKSGGLYCIEDSVTSYWPSWEGDDEVFDNNAYTIMGKMFDYCHKINLKRQETFNPPQTVPLLDWEKQIDSIHFHHSQIIIKKK